MDYILLYVFSLALITCIIYLVFYFLCKRYIFKKNSRISNAMLGGRPSGRSPAVRTVTRNYYYNYHPHPYDDRHLIYNDTTFVNVVDQPILNNFAPFDGLLDQHNTFLNTQQNGCVNCGNNVCNCGDGERKCHNYGLERFCGDGNERRGGYCDVRVDYGDSGGGNDGKCHDFGFERFCGDGNEKGGGYCEDRVDSGVSGGGYDGVGVSGGGYDGGGDSGGGYDGGGDSGGGYDGGGDSGGGYDGGGDSGGGYDGGGDSGGGDD